MEIKKIKLEIELTEKDWLELKDKLINYAKPFKKTWFNTPLWLDYNSLEINLANQIHKGLKGKHLK